VLNAGVKPAEDYERIYRNSIPNANLPSHDYLKTKRQSVFHKAFESGQQAQQYIAPVHPKQPLDTERLLQLFTHSFLTKNLDQRELKTLADAMFARKFSAGENIIRYGDIGAEYFVLAQGSVRVTVYKPGTNPFDPDI
jgi:CRP-like cAMP-binding protein